MIDRKPVTRHMEKATLYCRTKDFTSASMALQMATEMGDLPRPVTIRHDGKTYTVSITYANAWKVVET